MKLELKRPLFSDDILCIEFLKNKKTKTHKPLQLIHKFKNAAGYKMNTQKSVLFPNIINEKYENDIKNLK